MKVVVDIPKEDMREFLEEVLTRKVWIEAGMDSPLPSDRIMAKVAKEVKTIFASSDTAPDLV